MRSIRTRPEPLAAALVAAAGALLGVPLGCSGPLPAPIAVTGDAADAPARGGTLHLASFTDMRSLDPATGPDGLAMQAVTLLYDGLVDIDRGSNVVPDLAERWEIDDRGRTYRFTLRAGVRMHDGQELTADDVKRSVERALHPTTPNPQASLFEGLLGYADYVAGRAPHLAGVVVEGARVVSFLLAEPDAAFLTLAALPSLRPVCRSAGERYEATFSPCGAGPFRVEPGGWQRGASLRLVRHEGYFRPGLPYLDAVEWQFLVVTNSQRFRFLAGEQDLVVDPTQADYARYVRDPRWRPLGVPLVDNTTWGEAMNTRMPPFDNVEIRRAVAAAVDREHYALLRPANMVPASQLLPRGVIGYDPTIVGQVYDERAALEHMRKAGYPYDPATGKGGWPAPVVYTVPDQTTNFYTSQILQQTLARIGIRLELRLVSWPAYLALTQRAGSSAFHPQGNTEDYADPSAFFDMLFTTSSIRDEGSANTAFYSNPRFDDRVGRARHEMNPVARRALYRDAGELLCDEAPWAFAWGLHDFVIRQPYVRGFAAHPVWPLDVRTVWLDRPDEAGRVLRGGLR